MSFPEMIEDKDKNWLGYRTGLRYRLIQLEPEGLQEYKLPELFLTYVLHQRYFKPVAKEIIDRHKKGILDKSNGELKCLDDAFKPISLSLEKIIWCFRIETRGHIL
jgi:DNA repair protein RadC